MKHCSRDCGRYLQSDLDEGNDTVISEIVKSDDVGRVDDRLTFFCQFDVKTNATGCEFAAFY